MNEFKSLQSLWKQQSIIDSQKSSEAIIEESERLQKALVIKQKWTVFILSTWVLICIAFMIYVSAYRFLQSSLGIGLMIFSISIRIAIEFVSIKRFRTIKTIVSYKECSKKLLSFYQWRKKIFYLFVPIIFISYILGFIVLMPYFKKGLSTGFYYYIITSSVIIFIGLILFIRKQILSELRIIEKLSQNFN